MTRALPIAGLAAVLLAAGVVWVDAGEATMPPGDPALIEALSGIDYVPTKQELDLRLGATADDILIDLARNGNPTTDTGVRIRAYRALVQYDTPEVHAALTAAIAELGASTDPIDLLHLKAAMDSFATLAGDAAVDDLAPQLDHASLDVRAAAARALGRTESANALPPLRARLNVEPEDQVKSAISKAISALEPR